MTEEEKERLQNHGEYYSLAKDVWRFDVKDQFASGFDNIFREKHHSHFQTLLEECGLAKIKEGQSLEGSSAKKSTVLDASTDKSVSGEKYDLFGVSDVADDAHQVPESEICAPSYGIIGQAIMATNVEALSLQELEKISNCIDNKVGTIAEEGEEGEAECQETAANQELHERKKLVTRILKHLANDSAGSLKYLAVNKLRVFAGHHRIYHVYPEFITLPLLSLAEAKEWTPDTGYWIAIVASTTRAYRNYVGSKPTFASMEGRTVGEATYDELKKATGLLAAMVKAHAEIASDSRDGAVVSTRDFLQRKETLKMEHLQRTLQQDEEVLVPVLEPDSEKVVLKVKLEPHVFDYTVPDPMLVAMKAAINWYYMATEGTKLLPACGPPIDPEKALIEELNDEAYEEMMERLLRPDSWEDLARGLGQYPPSSPDGSQHSKPARGSLSPEYSFEYDEDV